MLAGLSPARQRALAIADNRIAENSGWNRERLAIEIPELTGLLEAEGLDVSILGFEAVEIDQLVTDFDDDAGDPEDGVDPKWFKDRPRSASLATCGCLALTGCFAANASLGGRYRPPNGALPPSERRRRAAGAGRASTGRQAC